MKLADGYITHDADGEHIMVAAGQSDFKGLVRSNETAAFIISCLKEETTPEEIKQKVFDRFDAPEEKISNDVDAVLGKLRTIGAIEE